MRRMKWIPVACVVSGAWAGIGCLFVWAVLLLWAVLPFGAAYAEQSAAETLRPIERPSERRWPRDPLTPGETGTAPNAPLILPPIPMDGAGSRRDDRDAQLRLTSVVVEGNRVIDAAELQAAAAPYLNRAIDEAELEALRRALTGVFVDAGYVNSGAVLPSQDLSQGRLRVEIIEGSISQIRISGLRHYRETIIRDRLQASLEVPFRMDTLERQLQILDQDPRIEQITAQLRPGASRSEAILEVLFREADPRQLSFSGDNHEAPSGGAFAGRIGIGHQNVFGLGDRFRLDFTRTEGLTRLSSRYAIPVHRSGTRLFFEGSVGLAELVGDAFSRLQIETRSLSLGGGIGQTLFRSPTNEIDASILLERNRSETSLFGRGFSFAEGPESGRTEITALRGSLEWTRRGQDSIFAFRSVLSLGLDAFDPTVQSGSRPDGIFLSWLGQLRGVYRFPTSAIELRLRADLQLSDRPLLSLEQFAVGGSGSVRGYRRNQLVRDQGFAVGFDVRAPLWKAGDGRTLLSAGPFADVGRAWNRDRPTPGIRTLSGIGAGLEWTPRPNFEIDLEWAYPIRDANTSGDLQDEAFYFRAVWWAI